MRRPLFLSATCLGIALLGAPAWAENALPSKADVETVIDEAQAWLLSKQMADGTFAKDQYALGITGLATQALALQPHGLPGNDPALAKAFAFLKSNQQPDGGIYSKEQGLGNYCTSITLMALAAAGKLDEEKELVKKGQQYLFGIQIADPKDKNFGGIGYDQDDGPGHQDLPNTVYGAQALRSTGVPAEDPHLQAAVKFLEKCQNLSSVNDLPWVDSSDDSRGGAVYSHDESKAEGSDPQPENKADPVKKLHSTGSMTYSLLSTYIALDLKKDDPRVSAALDWCKRHYELSKNPGMTAGHETEGLLYYYVFMAKTMRTLGLKELELADGKKVDWRADLFAAVKAMGHEIPAGDKKLMMFSGPSKRWGEAFPHLATAYMVKVLKDIDAAL